MNIYRAAIRQYDRAMARWDRRIVTAPPHTLEKVKQMASKADESWNTVLKCVLEYHENPARRTKRLIDAYTILRLIEKDFLPDGELYEDHPEERVLSYVLKAFSNNGSRTSLTSLLTLPKP